VFLLVAIIGFLFFYAVCCSRGNDYFIRFTASGEEVEFCPGFVELGENAFANVIGTIEDGSTLFVAIPETADSTALPGTYI
jgi:hypothetical protein